MFTIQPTDFQPTFDISEKHICINQVDYVTLKMEQKNICLSGAFPEPSEFVSKHFPYEIPLAYEHCQQIARLRLDDLLDRYSCEEMYTALLKACQDVHADLLIINAAPAAFSVCKNCLGDHFSETVQSYLFTIAYALVPFLEKASFPVRVVLPTTEQISAIPDYIDKQELIKNYVNGFPKLLKAQQKNFYIMHNQGFDGVYAMDQEFHHQYQKSRFQPYQFWN
jgi:hypothetical protein